MLERSDSEPLGSPLLQELYGEGYFHGANSGFAHEGYDQVHATWRHWMDWVRTEAGAGARWLDLGCAYGFLVVEARAAGFEAIGLDASRYALDQVHRHAEPARGRVVQAHAERLPFADASFAVVSAFDLVEHVPAPELVLAEVARILRPGGLFLAATPDPMVFDREEPTHVAEHAPSWWVRELERAGFAVSLRFFQADFNCELIARRTGPAPRISFDALAPDPVLEVAGDATLRVALRSNFSATEPDGSRIVGDGAMLYLLNAGDVPLEVAATIETADPASMCLTLDGRVVVEAEGATIEAKLLLPSGGHHLRFAVAAGWARLRSLRLDAKPSSREVLLRTLPFDLYERYALAAEVARRVAPAAKSLLDVGGTLGGDAGHLAWPGDFFPERDVVVVDGRGADVPGHRVLAGDGRLPFADRSFSIVSAQDVLEHVPPAERNRWLEEVWRVTDEILLLGNPWATPGVVEADRYLFEMIRDRYRYEHRFLAEHLSYGHPELEATARLFAERGASVTVLPSLSLAGWISMQTANALLSHPRQDQSFARANEAFNAAMGLRAAAPPVYRHLLVVDRAGRSHREVLRDLVEGSPADAASLAAALRALPERVHGGDGGEP